MALGSRAPGSYAEFAGLTRVDEAHGAPKATDMIADLGSDQATLVESARTVVQAADEAGDLATADLGTRRIEVHEKSAWMLRSHLE